MGNEELSTWIWRLLYAFTAIQRRNHTRQSSSTTHHLDQSQNHRRTIYVCDGCGESLGVDEEIYVCQVCAGEAKFHETCYKRLKRVVGIEGTGSNTLERLCSSHNEFVCISLSGKGSSREESTVAAEFPAASEPSVTMGGRERDDSHSPHNGSAREGGGPPSALIMSRIKMETGDEGVIKGKGTRTTDDQDRALSEPTSWLLEEIGKLNEAIKEWFFRAQFKSTQ
ncbi:uncharacterized protein B0H64DRAFT_145193 [Chaetomium fimeti]|uniref:Uncharacterized protein n=1 Tax=Chaetomium fimeti TaxID=1854472 RepID=A0AAE0HFD0_9PEZI|nr:hypothetical protein B0H64DRAFT_145193 [Chaetomium fimeti]